MTYNVVEDAKTVALEADFMGRWQEQREQMWGDITTMLPANERIYVYRTPPPKVLTWWRRMILRYLLQGEA